MEAEVIPVLRVAYADAAVSWYERLGFTKQWEHRFEPDCPAFVSIARDRARLFLSEHRGDARPDTLVHLVVRDIDAVVAEFGRPAGDPPYGCDLPALPPAGLPRRFVAPWASLCSWAGRTAGRPVRRAQAAKWAADEPARRWGGGRRAGVVRPAAALTRKPGQTLAGSLALRV
jgi:hypothetical protein